MEEKEIKIYKNMQSFSKNLKSERLAKGYTQKEMANLLSIRPQSYQAYEVGLSYPTCENLIKIAVILDISLDQLFDINLL